MSNQPYDDKCTQCAPPVHRRPHHWRGGFVALVAAAAFMLPIGQAYAGDIDIDRATWRDDLNRLTVRGDSVPDNATVTIRYGQKEDNGAVIATTEADGDGDWILRVFDLNPVPCDVTAQADGEDDDREVRNAPNNCSNDGGVVQPPQVCNIAVSPTTLAFGDVTLGNSPTMTTTVSNSGAAACDVTLSGIAGSDFSATPTGFSVAPNSSQTVSVTYAPGQAGADSDTLVVSSNDPDTETVNVALTGNGVQQQVQECNISVNPLALSFGDVNLGNSPTLSTTVSNSGAAACSVNLARTGSDDFAITSATSFNVAPGGSQTVSVSYTPGQVGADTGNVAVNSNDPDTGTVDVGLTGNGVDQQVQCVPADLNISINSTAQNGCPDGTVPQVAQVPNNSYSVLAINDLGMHCGDLDTRISSILPPFQVLLAQVVQKGATPTLNPAGVEVFYSASDNPNDPILGGNRFDGVMANGDSYKTNFWDFPVPAGTYDAFYPAFNPFTGDTLTPLAGPPFNVSADVGLPVPNVEHFYIGTDGIIGNGDEFLGAVLHAMPGIAGPYTANDPKLAEEHYGDKPFFINFPFGYVAANVNWYEGAGVPFAAFDDNGRENAYPLVRVEARNAAGATLSTVDTVLPISGEANCGNCHAEPDDLLAVTGNASRSSDPTNALLAAGLTPALSLDDPDANLPPRVSLEYAADINVLRLHDVKHGANYVNTSCDTAGVDCVADPAIHDPCTIDSANPNGSPSCLTNQALVQGKPVVCQVCHYTPALDLAQLGPLAGPEGSIANGRNQLAHSSNSNVMHSHHGGLGNLFPPMPAPNQQANGSITNQAERLTVLEDTCYQCHPGTNVQCLRGAMFNAGMLCNDCHGDMEQVGNDFTAGVSPTTPGAFVLDQGNFYDPNSNQPRVPWANEPGCGSCHTGTATDNLVGSVNSIVNTRDIDGNVDGIRLRQAYRTGDAKATPIVPTNKRFAEPAVPASYNGFANPGAGNPQLYRVSTGHGGVMCEGCHGATHAEWPNSNPASNDNVTADQLQGHVGALIECGTCHTNVDGLSPDGSLSSLQGPHGLHAVGNTSFARGDHRRNRNNAECRACHGQNGEGTVLSRMAEDRVLECKDSTAFCSNGNSVLFPKGHAVGCTECHGNEL